MVKEMSWDQRNLVQAISAIIGIVGGFLGIFGSFAFQNILLLGIGFICAIQFLLLFDYLVEPPQDEYELYGY